MKTAPQQPTNRPTDQPTNQPTDRRLGTPGRETFFLGSSLSLKAFCYVRVLPIPTPGWTTYDTKVFGVKHPEDVPTSIQEHPYPRRSGLRSDGQSSLRAPSQMMTEATLSTRIFLVADSGGICQYSAEKLPVDNEV